MKLGLDHCFVCGKNNPHGLHVTFEQVGEDAVATYQCTEDMNGWPGIQHGGITAALLDEAAGYVPRFLGVVTVTARLDIRYLEPIRIGEKLRITGRLIKRTARKMEVESTIAGEDGTIKAQSLAVLVVLNDRQREKLGLAEIS